MIDRLSCRMRTVVSRVSKHNTHYIFLSSPTKLSTSGEAKRGLELWMGDAACAVSILGASVLISMRFACLCTMQGPSFLLLFFVRVSCPGKTCPSMEKASSCIGDGRTWTWLKAIHSYRF